MNKRKIGTEYEKIAGKYLEEQGYEVIVYNYRCPVGEIDLIAKEDGYLVFCEVKYRRTKAAGHPWEAVTPAKQKKISKCAAYYLTTTGTYGEPCRFDVVGILGEEILLLKNAFEYAG